VKLIRVKGTSGIKIGGKDQIYPAHMTPPSVATLGGVMWAG